jgi:molecular chaperone GrpE
MSTHSSSQPFPFGDQDADLASDQPDLAATVQTALQDAAAIIDKLETEKADLKDKLLRTLADMENLRRRTEREVAEARLYAAANFARDMLNVADNVRRALDNVPSDAAEQAEGPFKALFEGIELTERDLLNIFERHNVKIIKTEGQKFDPNLHQAMFEIENPELSAGTIVQTMQTGYAIGERVLRPAMVGVSKGGPKSTS